MSEAMRRLEELLVKYKLSTVVKMKLPALRREFPDDSELGVRATELIDSLNSSYRAGIQKKLKEKSSFSESRVSEEINDLVVSWQQGFGLATDQIYWLLAVASGRRASEVCEAAFTVDSGHLWFHGQLKLKERQLESYKIPCLIDVEVFMDLVEYIKYKRLKRFPKTCKVFNEVGLSKPKDCRLYYASWLYKYCPDTIDRSTYVASALGHSEEDVATVRSYLTHYLTR